MRLGEPHPYIDPEAAAPKLMGIANSTEPVQDGRIHIELFNRPFLQKHRGYKAGLDFTIERGWPWKQERGTYVKITRDQQ
jgi:hypothetical protein